MIKIQHFARQFVLLLLVLFTGLAQAQENQPLESSSAENKGFLWQVSDNNSSVYLLGSVHFANADYYPLSRATDKAFAAADTLAVEVDITSLDPIKTQQLMSRMGNYQDGRTLKDVLSPETYQELEAYLEKQRIPLSLIGNQKPGMLIMSLTSMELMKLGMLPQFGIDQHFLTRAKGSKRIVELESLQQQLELLLNMDNPDQAISQTLEEFPTFPELASQLFSAWQSGDTTQMELLLIDEPLQKYPESRAFFDKMFTERNLTMTDKIKGYLDEDSTVFVVVGAGHLIGEQGIVKLLKEAGFKAERH